MNSRQEVQAVLLPTLTVPVLRTADLRRLTAFYCHAMDFRLLQEVPGVLAYMAHGPVRMQLWQSAGVVRDTCRITLDGPEENVFQIYRRLSGSARALLHESAPRLKPWGAWEFALTDIDGNRLMFVQWGRKIVPAQTAPRSPDHRSPSQPGGAC